MAHHRVAIDGNVVVVRRYPAAMGFVIGAAIALIGSVVVQWVVVPRVNRRTRALDRWEQDVLLLGGLVSDELSVARAKAFDAWRSWRSMREVWWSRSWPDSAQRGFASDDRDFGGSFREAWREYERLVRVRLHWLVKRISSRDQRYSAYAKLEVSILRLGAAPLDLLVDSWTEDNIGDIERWWTTEEEERKRLLHQVAAIAATIAAPSPLNPLERARVWRNGRTERRSQKKRIRTTSG